MTVKCPNCDFVGEIDDNASGDVDCPQCGNIINLEDAHEETLNKNFFWGVMFVVVALFIVPTVLWWLGVIGFFKSVLCYAIGLYIWCCAYKKLEKEEEMIDRKRGL